MDQQKILEELDKIISNLENVNYYDRQRFNTNQKQVIKAYDIAYNLRQILKRGN